MKPLAVLLCVALVPSWGLAQPVDGGAPPRKYTKKELTTVDRQAAKAAAEIPLEVPRKFTWDIPQQMDRVEVPGLVEGMGTPVKLHAVRTRLKLLDIMDFMEREFARYQLYVAPRKDLTQLTSDPQLHGFDPYRKIGFSVIFQPNPDGTTTLILGEAHLSEGRGTATGFALPVHPRAQGVIQSRQEGATVVAYSLVAPQQEVEQYYRDVLGMQGYSPLGKLKFRKGDQQVVVSYHPNQSTGAAGVVLTQSGYAPEGPVDPNAAPAAVH